MEESLEQIAARILKSVPSDCHDDFLDWAISGHPIRTESQKQAIIEKVKLLSLSTTREV